MVGEVARIFKSRIPSQGPDIRARAGGVGRGMNGISQGTTPQGTPQGTSKDFTKLLGAYAASQLGDQITLLALPLTAALALGAGPQEMGWLAAAASAPFFLFGLPAGVWVDRLPHRSVMLAADLARALVLLAVPAAALLGVLTLPLLIAVALLSGTAAVFVDIASQSYVPILVGRERLIQANSRFETSRAAATTGGPALAGLLAGAIGPGFAVAVSAAASLAAAACMGAIRARETGPSLARRAFLVELREGLAFLAAEPRLRALTLCALVWNVSWFALGAVMVLYAARDLGLSGAEIGLAFAADGVGMVLGALVAPRVEQRFGLGRAIVIGPGLCALGTPLILLAGPGFALPLLLAGRFLYGFGPMIFAIGATSLRQTLTPPALLGRVNASVRWLTNGFRPFGALLGGLAGAAFGLDIAVALAGSGFVLCLVPLLLSPVPRLVRLQA